MRIDLHTHSTASDGTDAPAQVVADAAAAGLDVVALTDHDTTSGWPEAAAAARDHGIALVRGTEVSARAHGISIHLLSYLQDPTHPALTVELDRTRDARLHRARAIVELLAVDVPITWDDVLEHSRDAVVVGRPHIADALVALGIVPDRDAAFAHLLSAAGPYHVPHYAPDGPDAVRAIRAAGGVPVFAHPGADARGRIVPDRVFDRLADGRPGRDRGGPPRPLARAARAADRDRRPARAAGDRVERLPRCRQGQPARGEPDRARGARGDRGAGDDSPVVRP